ncbi:unnamed protein product [Durusdinium trenchii]|uniref:Uncharacterized protein n=1 Tax=Durusdinium trenchii TaxID=1381693 RepID=A0ABP0R514_9DINO
MYLASFRSLPKRAPQRVLGLTGSPSSAVAPMALRAIWATPLLYALEPLPLAAEPPASCPAPSLSATELYEVLNCSEEEPALEKAFAYWGTEKLNPNVFKEFCGRLPLMKINVARVAPLYAFRVVLLERKIYMSCCASAGSCEDLLKTGFKSHRDLRESCLICLKRRQPLHFGAGAPTPPCREHWVASRFAPSHRFVPGVPLGLW